MAQMDASSAAYGACPRQRPRGRRGHCRNGRPRRGLEAGWHVEVATPPVPLRRPGAAARGAPRQSMRGLAAAAAAAAHGAAAADETAANIRLDAPPASYRCRPPRPRCAAERPGPAGNEGAAEPGSRGLTPLPRPTGRQRDGVGPYPPTERFAPPACSGRGALNTRTASRIRGRKGYFRAARRRLVARRIRPPRRRDALPWRLA